MSEAIDFGSMALLEERNAPAWYSLPDGWTWRDVARIRFERDIPSRLFPLASAPGVTAWGRPLPR